VPVKRKKKKEKKKKKKEKEPREKPVRQRPERASRQSTFARDQRERRKRVQGTSPVLKIRDQARRISPQSQDANTRAESGGGIQDQVVTVTQAKSRYTDDSRHSCSNRRKLPTSGEHTSHIVISIVNIDHLT
jgi:hypothetical protein